MQFFLEVHECQKLFHYFILILQINIDVAELPIEDDVRQIVDQQQDEYRKHHYWKLAFFCVCENTQKNANTVRNFFSDGVPSEKYPRKYNDRKI